LQRTLQIVERVWNAFPCETLTERVKRLEHSCSAGVVAEKDQTAVLLVGDFLIVDERHLTFEHGPQHRHVVRLSFKGVREKHVCLAMMKKICRDFLHGKNGAAIGQILTNGGASLYVLCIAKYPDCRRLYNNLHSLFDERSHMVRR